jgi:hypothetical protein
MKDEPKAAHPRDHLPTTTIAEQVGEENLVQILHARSSKNVTLEQKKKEASKPIYLVRYE